MKLTEILVRDACIVDMRAKTKKEALRELADSLAGTHELLVPDALLEMLLERERLGTTAMGDGIAIPHARVEALGQVLAGFGRSRLGVDFDSVDGKRTHLFFLLVAPGTEGNTHLLTLARLSRFLTKPEFRSKLLEVEEVNDLFLALEEEESGD